MPDDDLTERARAIRRKIRQKFESEDPTWRSAVSRYSLTEKKADEFLAAALQSEREAAAAEARRALLEEIEAHCSDPASWPSAIYREVAEEVLDAVRALTAPNRRKRGEAALRLMELLDHRPFSMAKPTKNRM